MRDDYPSEFAIRRLRRTLERGEAQGLIELDKARAEWSAATYRAQCPECLSPAGTACLNSITGNPTHAPHPQRIANLHRGESA